MKRVIKNRKKVDNYLDYNEVKEKDFKNHTLARKIFKNYVIKQSKGSIHNLEFIDHHTCHAFYAAYAPKIKEKNSAIVTIDSEGDGINQTFWTFDKKRKKLCHSDTCYRHAE